MNYCLEIRNISKSYENHVALDNVSFAVENGSVYGLLGPNGAGKSTLIRIISQIIVADKGEILFHGKPMTQEDVFNIGYLPEERGLYKKMTVFDQLFYFAQLRGISKNSAKKIIGEQLEKFNLTKWWDKKIEVLSKGMAQKVQFIATTLHSPSLLILDEPFSGFDPVNANLLKEEILRLKSQGVTIMLSTHNMASVEEICNDISLIHRSKNILNGNVRNVRQQYARNLYEVKCVGDIDVIKNKTELSIQAIHSEENFHTLQLQITVPNFSITELLTLLNEHVSIESFQKIVPGMNDIFLELVQKN